MSVCVSVSLSVCLLTSISSVHYALCSVNFVFAIFCVNNLDDQLR